MPKTPCDHCGKEYVNVREHITKTHSWVSMPGDYETGDVSWKVYYLDRYWESAGCCSQDREGDTESMASFYYKEEGSEEMLLDLHYLKDKSKITRITVTQFRPKKEDWKIIRDTINPKIMFRNRSD